MKGQVAGQVSNDEVLTGIGPVLTFELTRVRWKRRAESMGLGAIGLEMKSPGERGSGSNATHSEIVHEFSETIGGQPYGETI
jgi:hypothetical protein